MQTVSYTKIPNAEKSDIGKTCLMALGCNPIAIEDTLDECQATALAVCASKLDEDDGPITADDVDDHTDLRYLATGDLVAVIVGEAEEIETCRV